MFLDTARFAIFFPTDTAQRPPCEAGAAITMRWADEKRRPDAKTFSNSRRDSRSRFLSTLDREALATFCAAALQYTIAARSAATHQEAVGRLALLLLWLICTLRHTKCEMTIAYAMKK